MRLLTLSLSGLLLFEQACSPSLPSSTPWEPMGGPYAQNLSTVLVAEKHPSEIFAASTSGEIFGSNDHGESWSKRATVRPNVTIHRILQHPEVGNRLYASTGAGLFVSTNKGIEWSESPIEGVRWASRSTRVLAIDPWSPKLMYAGVKGRGVYKTSNGGETWSGSNRGLDSTILALGDTYDIKINPLAPDVLYAAVSGIGLVKSTNAGASWSTLTGEITPSGLIPTCIAINERTSEIVCFGTNTGSIYRSVNGGTAWSPTKIGFGSDQILRLDTHPVDSEVLYAGTSNGVIVSHDFGTTWKDLSISLPHIKTSVAVSPSKTLTELFVYGEGVGLQRSRDEGTTWQHTDTRLAGSMVSQLVADKAGEKLFAVVGTALLYYDVQTSSWMNKTEGLTGGTILSVSFDTEASTALYAGTSRGLFNTTDGGDSWSPAAPELRGTPVFFADAHPIIRTRMYSLVDNKLFMSTDKGVSWIPTRPRTAKYNLHALTFAPGNAGLIHGATEDGKAVIATSDGGFTWETRRSGITRDNIVAITINDREPQTYYAWTSTGEAYRSTNAGVQWQMVSPPWKPGNEVRIALNGDQPSEAIAVVTGTQIFFTTTGGATWSQVPAANIDREITALHWNSKTSTLYAGTKGSGVYRLILGGTLKNFVNQ